MKKTIVIIAVTLVSMVFSCTAFAAETTGEPAYGYPGIYDETAADNECLIFFEGTQIIDGAVKNCHQENAFQNYETSVMIIKDSFVKDSVLPVVTSDVAQSYFIRSTVESTSGGAVFAGEAAVPEEGALPLTNCFYGSKIDAQNSGAAIYNELLCDAYIYGSYITGSATGIESETFGNITIGGLADSTENAALTDILAEMGITAGVNTKSIIESGKNAIILSSSYDPYFTEMEGFSKEILDSMSSRLTIRNSEVKTVKPVELGQRFRAADTPYTDHSKGSVILIKSTNADIVINDSIVESYRRGTGDIIQSVLNDNEEYIMSVADGEEASGIHVSVSASELTGNISHEDYQRKMQVELSAVNWTGSASECSVEQWNAAAEEEGFGEAVYDESYNTHNGLFITLTDNSSWVVTEESSISGLIVEEGSSVSGTICVDGEAIEVVPGEVYEGAIVIAPAA